MTYMTPSLWLGYSHDRLTARAEGGGQFATSFLRAVRGPFTPTGLHNASQTGRMSVRRGFRTSIPIRDPLLFRVDHQTTESVTGQGSDRGTEHYVVSCFQTRLDIDFARRV